VTRILHVITGLSTGGAEIMLLNLLAATSGNHCQAVISLKDEGTIGPKIRELGIPVYSVGMRRWSPNPFRALPMISAARSFNPQVIQGWMYHGNLMASLAGAGMQHPTPVVWDIQQSITSVGSYGWMTGAVIRLGALVSKHPSTIIYASRTGANQHENLGFHAARQIIIPNAIDCQAFHPDSTWARQIRDEFGFDDDTVLVGQVARFHPMKDHAGFLRAAALLVQRYPSARFVLIGTNVTMEQPVLRQLVVELQLQDRVVLLGERSDMPRLTAALDIACSPSAWGEAFSLAIGEAMASGVPCVVTDVGDSAFIVADTGFSVPPSDAQALAHAIGQLIEAGPDYRRQLGRAARRRIENEFSLPEIARRFEELYQRLSKRKSGDFDIQPAQV